jgi:hypothetical protein
MLLSVLVTAALAATTVSAKRISNKHQIETVLAKTDLILPKNAVESWAIANKHAKVVGASAFKGNALRTSTTESIGWFEYKMYTSTNCQGGGIIFNAQYGTCLMGTLTTGDPTASMFTTYNGVVDGYAMFTAETYETSNCSGTVYATNMYGYETNCNYGFQYTGVSDTYTLPSGYFTTIEYNTETECNSNTDYSNVESSFSIPTEFCMGGVEFTCTQMSFYEFPDCSGISTIFSISDNTYGLCSDDDDYDDDYDDDDYDDDFDDFYADDFVVDSTSSIECTLSSSGATLAMPSALAAVVVAVAAFFV